MAGTWIVRLPLSEGADQPVLLYVTQKKSHDLDLDLLATEGEVVYKGKVRNKKLKDLRSNRDISDEDFAAILRYVLVSRSTSSISESQQKSLEVVASVSAGKKSDKTLTITFRNRIDGITQRLGEVDLPESDDEISLFDWAAMAVERQNTAETELATLKDQYEAARTAITSLQTQLEDLTKAKVEHEDQLLSKFCLLLNEKKLKIRNQQRVLDNAKVDRKKLKSLQTSLEGEQITSRTTRRGKRRADEADPPDDSDSDEAFETAAGATGTREIRRTESSRSTTPETETASEDDDMPDASAEAQPPAAATRAKTASPIPEPRRLPFTKEGEKQKNPAVAAVDPPTPSLASDEETASEDDEL